MEGIAPSCRRRSERILGREGTYPDETGERNGNDDYLYITGETGETGERNCNDDYLYIT